jgi:hypothetical protein
MLADKIKISQVDGRAECLSEDKYRIFAVNGIGKQDERPYNTEIPERFRYHALPAFFRRYPLYNKTHGKKYLAGQPYDDPVMFWQRH